MNPINPLFTCYMPVSEVKKPLGILLGGKTVSGDQNILYILPLLHFSVLVYSL